MESDRDSVSLFSRPTLLDDAVTLSGWIEESESFNSKHSVVNRIAVAAALNPTIGHAVSNDDYDGRGVEMSEKCNSSYSLAFSLFHLLTHSLCVKRNSVESSEYMVVRRDC